MMVRKLLLVLCAFALFVSACGGGDDESTETDLVSTTSSVATTTTLAPTTTSTEAILTGNPAPLTGEPAGEGVDLNHPAIAVKVGNNDNDRSRPQAGLASADIVFELIIEAEVTRFLALFHSAIPEAVAPVRSGRSSDVDIVGAFNTPMLAFWGSNTVVGRELRAGERAGLFTRTDIDRVPSGLYVRDSDRAGAPYNGTLLAQDLLEQEASEENGIPEPVFTYSEVDDEPIEGDDVGGVLWQTNNRESSFLWDGDAWLRMQEGTLHADADGEQIEVDNVIVMFVRYTTSAADPQSAQAITTGEGEAWVLSDGQIRQGFWLRPENTSGWQFVDVDGTELPLAPGSSWVYLARSGDVTELDTDAGADLLAEAIEASE